MKFVCFVIILTLLSFFALEVVSLPSKTQQHGGDLHVPEETKRKIASTVNNVKDKVSEIAYKTAAAHKDAAKEVIEIKKEIAMEAKDKLKETAIEKGHLAKDLAREILDAKKDAAYKAKDKVEDLYKKTIESTTKKGDEVKESVKEKTKDSLGNLKDIGKTLRHDIAQNMTEDMDLIRKQIKKTIRFVFSMKGFNYFMGVVNYLGFSVAFGMSVWVTCISSHVLATALPKQQFGMVQRKICPVYFRTLAVAMAAGLSGNLLGKRRRAFKSNGDVFQVVALSVAELLVLPNLFCLERWTKEAMFEKIKLEKEDGGGREAEAEVVEPRREEEQPQQGKEEEEIAEHIGAPTPVGTPAAENPEEEELRRRLDAANERLERLETYSSFLNKLTVMALSFQLLYMGQCLL